MMKTISGLFIAVAGVLILWSTSWAQYGQDTTSRMPSDTTMRSAPTDTTHGLFPNRSTTDTTTGRSRYNRDTTRTRTWTPQHNNQTDTSGVHY